jgi:TetR/AcrR family transcriptional repressor of lmrAB and yxaGH operons
VAAEAVRKNAAKKDEPVQKPEPAQKTDARQKMIDGAVRLLAQRGLQATSFSEVLELTGAPRGSIYHHFPDGKDQLVAAAVDLAGTRALELLEQWADDSPVAITEKFLGMWRALLVHARFTAGCSVLAVTVASGSPELLEHSKAVFRSWRGRLAELFEKGGLSEPDATRFAALLVASSEGAVVLSRAEQSLEPFELVAGSLVAEAERLTP